MKKLNLTSFFATLLFFSLTAQNYNLELRSSVEFPNQTLANVGGYVQNGKEYGLICAQLGLIIFDVTDPANPAQIVQVPGVDNLWREVKTYGHYAYVTTEGGPVQVIDLGPLPSPNLPVFVYNGDGPIAGEIHNVHALHVDETKGFLYLFGSGAGVSGTGGALVCDLNPDPFHPTFVGEFQSLGYIHDGYADNDTLYGAHIWDGLLTVVDMTDKQNPDVLGSTLTPLAFTHNAWPTADKNTVLITDEKDFSFLAAFDVSDPTNIVELDRFQCTPGSGSIPHNVHIVNDFAVTSWYTDGFNIVDASRPTNLVQVGWYDTYPEQTGGGYNGCWGVYPFLPSGNIIATNIPVAFAVGTGKMFILTPTYKRACYLEGSVTDGTTGQPLSGVSISIDSDDLLTATSTGILGSYTTGQPTPGTFPVTFSLTGYASQTIDAVLVNGQVTLLDVEMLPPPNATIWLEEQGAQLRAFPNVFFDKTTVEFRLPKDATEGELRLTDLAGREVWHQKVAANDATVVLNENMANGTFFLTLHVGNRQTKPLQLTKVD
ncbi:MAG: choice-of-anchor B family protein [Bacteroidetes bacterium]|nr:choice-of-anchor B family protein [Bacteroidota bacterium]